MSDMVDNITDWALNEYIRIYEDDTITKEDIFYYTYGILHSPGYRKKYQAFLVRGLPNIPHAPDFRAYEKAGRQLADLHLNFETCPRYDLGEPVNPIPQAPKKIQFGKKPNDGPGPKMIPDHSVLILDGSDLSMTIIYHISDTKSMGERQYNGSMRTIVTESPKRAATPTIH